MVMEYKRHPLAALAHPTPEMITPLIVALGILYYKQSVSAKALGCGRSGIDGRGRARLHGEAHNDCPVHAYADWDHVGRKIHGSFQHSLSLSAFAFG
jgi:hypothetical protein